MRLPRPPDVVAPTVVVGATSLDVDDAPKGPRIVARRALANGWQVMITVALGVDTFKRKIDGHLIDVTDFVETYAVRMSNGTAHQFAVWRDSGNGPDIERGYCVCRTVGIHRVSAADLGTVNACMGAGSVTITETKPT